MIVVGIDLSGPSNPAGTVLIALQEQNQHLCHVDSRLGADDRELFDVVSDLAAEDEVAVGLDAPLSYNMGGGDRRADGELRRKVMDAGLPAGTVMVPTMTRMAFLTLRGIAVARSLEAVEGTVNIVEVHPTACLALRGAPADTIRAMKDDAESRASLLHWLENQGLEQVSQITDPTHDYVAACGAALAAWKWALDEPVWIEPAQPPFHPYDFAC